MRMAICDDDEQEISYFSKLISEYQISRGVNFDCHFFHNSIDFLCDIKGGEYQLVLLNVLMPEVSGMQAAQELRELDKNVKIIFISASPEFALESYRVGAYHYLLKPVEADLFFSLLDTIRSELLMQEEQGLMLKSREGVVRISFAGLEYVEVINKTVSFHLANGVIYEVTAALADFEAKLLSRSEFIKTHWAYLVNLNYVQSVGTDCIMTKNGHSIPVSRQRHNQVQDAYMHFWIQAGKKGSEGTAQNAAVLEKEERAEGPWRILLVDDDPAERTFWADILRSHGCEVLLAENGNDALKLVMDKSCDCVLLDVMIPGEDGFSICEKLHKLVQAPVIFLSSLTEADRQVDGFAAGGIDYITKDTPVELFWAKVETRIKLAMSDRTQVRYGPLLLDLTKRRVMLNEEELLLTPIEFDILWCLSEHTGGILSLEEIFNRIWGSQHWVDEQMVQIHMSRLRRKMEKAWGEHHFIEAVWGQGYRFVPPYGGMHERI